MNYFTLYDGTDGASASKTSLEFGVGLSGTGVWDAPARKGESISIPGRNGNIWVDDGSWDNILVTYPCWIADGFDQKVDEFRGWLARHSDQYYRITDTYHPDEYRLGRFAGEFLATPGTRNLSGWFDVAFECDPRRFSIEKISASGEFVTDAVSIEVVCNNPFDFNIYPIIKLDFDTPPYVHITPTIERSYDATIKFNGKTVITIRDPDQNSTIHTVYIDTSTGTTFADADMTIPVHIGGLDSAGTPGGISITPNFLSPGENIIRGFGMHADVAAGATVAFELSGEGYRI